MWNAACRRCPAGGVLLLWMYAFADPAAARRRCAVGGAGLSWSAGYFAANPGLGRRVEPGEECRSSRAFDVSVNADALDSGFASKCSYLFGREIGSEAK
jgi:hypothetical protein